MVFCLHMRTVHVPGAYRDQKRAPDPQELDPRTVVSHPCVCWELSLDPFLTAEPSLQDPALLIYFYSGDGIQDRLSAR